jgi:hypothetical protein
MFAGVANAPHSCVELADRIWSRIRHLVRPFTFHAGAEQYHSSSGYSLRQGYGTGRDQPFMGCPDTAWGDFRWHTDTVHATALRVGFQTLLLCLNEDVSGGETELRSPDDGSHSVTL